MGDVLIGRPIRLVATAGPGQGRGHLSRALSLAEALVERGAAVSLELVRGGLDGEAAIRAARIGLIPASPAPDAIVVVDLPDLDSAEERAPAARLVVFDDRDAFRGRAAIVVQPSLPTWSGGGGAGRVLAGFDYVPVAARYRELRAANVRPPRRPAGSPADVLVCFGGSDPQLVTERLVPTLARGHGWRTTAVVGADYAGRTETLPIPIVRDPGDLPERLAAADLVVIGAGTMKFEVACLGRPAILLAVADDQLSVGPPYAGTGAADYLGDGRTIDPELVRAAVARLLADRSRRAAMARTARDLVDGDGARRIAEAVLAVAAGDPP